MKIALSLGAALSLVMGTAQAAELEIPFEKYELDNGLTVILSQDDRLPQVAVNVWYHVGAANQSPGKSGFAHLFEHMMFSGSQHVGPEPFKVLESIGTAAGSQANGTTSFDRTNYFEVVPAAELPTALWIESDRMAFLLETLDEEKLRIQRDVVSNERRQSYENRPYGTSQLRLCDVLYPAPHPYYNCVIGTISEIQSASMDDLKSFFNRFYAPNNASLAIVGNFDKAKAKELVEKYFGDIPAGEEVPRPVVEQPMFDEVVRETVEDPLARLPKVSIVWNGVKPYSEDEPAGDVLSMILGGGKTSRLYDRLVFGEEVAVMAAAYNPALGLGGFFGVDVIAKPGNSLDDMRALVQEEIDSIKEEGVTEEEVARAKRNILAAHLRPAERIGGFGGKADLLNQYEMWRGDPGWLKQDIARYEAVTAEQVQAFANEYLHDDKKLILETVPAQGAPTASAVGSKNTSRNQARQQAQRQAQRQAMTSEAK